MEESSRVHLEAPKKARMILTMKVEEAHIVLKVTLKKETEDKKRTKGNK